MFSRTVFRSSLRAPPRATPRVLPKAPLRTRPLSQTAQRLRNYPPPPPPPPYGRRPDRIIHYKYDPEAARSAKPLLTSDQVFNTIRSPKTKWVAIICAGSATVFYFTNLEEVPVSGRRRFNCYSDASVEAEGQRMYQMVMQESRGAILPDWDPRVRMVNRVMSRLIPASGLEHVDWEVHVISSPEKNAFVIPGGKVFVYSGIIPIAGNDDGLAAILGHEIAHNLARHAAESMSSLVMFAPIRWVLIFLDATGYTMGLGRILGDFAMELGLARPASRKQESEADYIGLMMMARSCYNPSEAVGVWERMEKAMTQQEQVPEWLSTHPSNVNRIERMQHWLPKAEVARRESDCVSTIGYAKDFQSAMGNWGGFFRSA